MRTRDAGRIPHTHTDVYRHVGAGPYFDANAHAGSRGPGRDAFVNAFAV